MHLLRVYPLVLVVALALPFTPTVFANPIVGTIGFVVDGSFTPATGSLNTSISVTNVVTNNSATGNWTPFVGGTSVASLITFGAFPSAGGSFGFTDAGFGTFSGTVQFDSGETGNAIVALRQISVSGSFTPGTTLAGAGYTSPGAAQLDFVIQSINGGARSASFLFGTSAVPEPSTLVLTGLGISALATRSRWKKKRI
ncbi:MAG: PEP-CTERM sorting domain-containing protein [Planctomycetota bacterium]|jgi:hypothetical protein